MSDQENGITVGDARQGLAWVFRQCAEEVRSSDAPSEMRNALSGSIRHRANMVERADADELRCIGAAMQAWSEVLVVYDARMARGLQGCVACCDALVDGMKGGV